MGLKNLKSNKFWVHKKFGVKKFGVKQFGDKNFGVLNISGQKNIGNHLEFGVKQILGSKRMLT